MGAARGVSEISRMAEETQLDNEVGPSTRSDLAARPAKDFDAADVDLAADSALTEDLALALLQRADLPAEEIEQVMKNTAALKSRKVRLAVAGHSRTPRRIALRLIRELYTFDLMKFALLPAVAS